MHHCIYVISVAVGSACGGRSVTVTPNCAVQAEHLQSKQNHICALWWFQGFKSLTVEFSVGSSPVVQVARGRLWVSDLAGEWQEEMLLKHICQGVHGTAGDIAQMKLTLLFLPQANWICAHSTRRGRLVEADIFVCTVKCVTVAMNNTWEGHGGSKQFKPISKQNELRGSWMQQQDGAFTYAVLKTIWFFTFGK